MMNQLNLKPEREELQPGIVRSDEPASPEIALRALEQAAPVYPPPALARPVPVAATRPARPRRARVWLAAALAGVFIVSAIGFAGILLKAPSPSAVSLDAAEREGILRIDWEPAADPVAAALSGVLEITENGAVRRYDLTAADLQKGSFSVIRQSDSVTAKLSLNGPGGKVRQEIAHYLGNPLPSKVDPHVAEIEQLQAQNQALRAELEKERARANELQSWADVLESSLKKRAAR